MENIVENNENGIEQPAPVVEKISRSELKEEYKKIEEDQPTIVDGLIDAMMNLTDEQADMIMKELDKKIEFLQNMKGEKDGSK